jgi:hypothetical protein
MRLDSGASSGGCRAPWPRLAAVGFSPSHHPPEPKPPHPTSVLPSWKRSRNASVEDAESSWKVVFDFAVLLFLKKTFFLFFSSPTSTYIFSKEETPLGSSQFQIHKKKKIFSTGKKP